MAGPAKPRSRRAPKGWQNREIRKPEAVLRSQLEEEGIPFLPQYRFAKATLGRQWQADFALMDNRILIEVEGGTWMQNIVQPDGTVITGHHSHPVGYEKDCEKYNAAAGLGWRVLRFTTRMVNDGRALRTIQQTLGLPPRAQTWEQLAQDRGLLGQALTKGEPQWPSGNTPSTPTFGSASNTTSRSRKPRTLTS